MNPIVKILLIVAAAIAILAVPYHLGKNVGKLEVSSAWDKDRKNSADAVIKLILSNEKLQRENQETTTRISDELASKEKEHAKALADLRADYSGRLLQSATRQGIYQRQAEGSATERNHLASYAAQLDRSLEEGRSLVRELRQTVGQRDYTIRLLSEQITADRLLYNE